MAQSSEFFADSDLSQAYVYSNGVKRKMSSLATERTFTSPYASKLVPDGIPLLGSRYTGIAASNGTTDKGGTSRIGYVTPYAMHDPQAMFINTGGSTNGEAAAPNPITVSAAFDFNSVLYNATFNGQANVCIASGGVATTDPNVSIEMASGTTCFVRTYVQLSLPPLNQAVATSTSGGTLAAATYFYKVTQVAGSQGQSGQTVEVAR